MEVVHAIITLRLGPTGWDDLMKIKARKAESNGSFNKRIILINTTTKEDKDNG